MAKTSKAKEKGSCLLTLVIILIFLAGAGVLFYPTFSNLWNTYRNNQLISEYSQTVQDIPKTDYSAMWEAAREYNRQHTVNTIVDVFDEENKKEYEMSHPYDTLLDLSGNGVMGYINIPKINVQLAIYHGVGEHALENGVGHIEGTSLPIGGKSTHSVLSAHRGLPQAKLFTDLDQMEAGDMFFITVLDEKLAYQVDQIKTVLPEETDDLAIADGEDYCTLVTCTPYGVNSHRMLVRGKRVELTQEEEAQVEEAQAETKAGPGLEERTLLLGIGAFILLTALFAVIFRKKK